MKTPLGIVSYLKVLALVKAAPSLSGPATDWPRSTARGRCACSLQFAMAIALATAPGPLGASARTCVVLRAHEATGRAGPARGHRNHRPRPAAAIPSGRTPVCTRARGFHLPDPARRTRHPPVCSVVCATGHQKAAGAQGRRTTDIRPTRKEEGRVSQLTAKQQDDRRCGCSGTRRCTNQYASSMLGFTGMAAQHFCVHVFILLWDLIVGTCMQSSA